MSHHSDDGLLIVSSDSFWEPGNYKRTTKRIDDGFRLSNDLITLIQERGDIEKVYAKSLKNWSKKWNELIEKGPEYGTTEAACKACLIEADRRCDMHLKVKDRLYSDVIAQIKQWQKDNYHKSMMTLKQKKEMDDSFKKAQKPWAKLLSKVNKCKSDYHTCCKNERSAINQERNAASDTSLSPDQVKKLQERVIKCREEVQKTKEKYELSLKELNEYNAKYMEDMGVVFDKCQAFEERRLNFCKDVLFGLCNCLNISVDPELPQIYEEYKHSIQNADAVKDLKWWSNNHGVAMAMNWPMFEEYCEEFRDIIGKSKKGTFPESGILLVNQHRITEDLPEYNPDFHNISKKEKKTHLSESGVTLTSINNHNKSVNGNSKNIKNKPKDVSNQNSSENLVKSNGSVNMLQTEYKEEDISKINGQHDSTPFDDDQEEWDEGSNEALVDSGEPGVPVKALYDYEGAEADELSFKAGEIFEKLEDEDEQGWCKGRKDGKVGLYPASYVDSKAS